MGARNQRIPAARSILVVLSTFAAMTIAQSAHAQSIGSHLGAADPTTESLALGKLGWTLRRIELETGIRRETVSRYLKQAAIAVRTPGRWGHPDAKAAM